MAAAAHRYLLSLFMVGVAVQFFLAGLGVFRVQNGASDSRFESVFNPHRTLGNVLFILALIVLLAAIVARLGRVAVLAALIIPILVFLQSVFANNGPSWFRALHVLNAFVIAGYAGTMTGRYWSAHRATAG